MEKENGKHALCRSIFKNGNETVSQKQFTEKWIDLINQLEQRKCFIIPKQ